MNLSDIIAEVGRLVGDPNHDRWTGAVITTRANVVATDILALTNAVKTKETLTPVAGTATVSLDADTMDIIRVHIKNVSGEWKKLDGILPDQLDFEEPNWQQRDDGEPIRYWYDATNQQINLVPAPSSDWAQTDGLRVWEVRKPEDMADSTDIPFDSNNAMIPYHMAICYGTAANCLMDDNTPEAMSKSRFHRSGRLDSPGNFEREIKRILAKFDAPEDIPARILWRPQGGRATARGIVTKNNPFGQ